MKSSPFCASIFMVTVCEVPSGQSTNQPVGAVSDAPETTRKVNPALYSRSPALIQTIHSNGE